MQIAKGLRGVVAVVSSAAIAAAPLLVAPSGANASAERVTSQAAMPHLKATLTKKTIRLTGGKGLRAGRVKLSVAGRGTVEFVMFKAGYDVADFTRDVNKFGAKGDAKALKRALANTEILGGLAGGGTGTIVFPKAGAYTPISLGQRGVVTGKTLVVRGPARSTKAPRTDGSIIGKNGPAWGGSSHLPMKGRLLFKNRADEPHFVVMQQVVEGTTTDQVLEYLQSGEEGPPPSWALQAGMETGTLSPGRSMTVDYDLPAGQYVIMCFFPDPEMGGMPHALMGMLEMIHLM
jgi:hypothetical protein